MTDLAFVPITRVRVLAYDHLGRLRYMQLSDATAVPL